MSTCEHVYVYKRARAQGEPPSGWYCKHCDAPDPDPGPTPDAWNTVAPDGTRDADQWANTVAEGIGIIEFHLRHALDPNAAEDVRVGAIRQVAKEARRLESDVYRIASEVWGLSREEIG